MGRLLEWPSRGGKQARKRREEGGLHVGLLARAERERAGRKLVALAETQQRREPLVPTAQDMGRTIRDGLAHKIKKDLIY